MRSNTNNLDILFIWNSHASAPYSTTDFTIAVKTRLPIDRGCCPGTKYYPELLFASQTFLIHPNTSSDLRLRSKMWLPKWQDTCGGQLLSSKSKSWLRAKPTLQLFSSLCKLWSALGTAPVSLGNSCNLEAQGCPCVLCQTNFYLKSYWCPPCSRDDGSVTGYKTAKKSKSWQLWCMSLCGELEWKSIVIELGLDRFIIIILLLLLFWYNFWWKAAVFHWIECRSQLTDDKGSELTEGPKFWLKEVWLIEPDRKSSSVSRVHWIFGRKSS